MARIITAFFFLAAVLTACDHEDMFHAASSGITPVYVYSPTVISTGNLNGRAGADLFCKINKPSQLFFTSHVRAFLSVGPGDQLKDMADNYGIPKLSPIMSISGQLLALNWYDLLDGSIRMSMSALGVTAMNYWTGSTWDGSFLNACSGWTNGTASDYGYNGALGNTNYTWLQNSNIVCSTSISVLCLTW